MWDLNFPSMSCLIFGIYWQERGKILILNLNMINCDIASKHNASLELFL
jgi:hypothetical protein